jgi:hypothetical protein
MFDNAIKMPFYYEISVTFILKMIIEFQHLRLGYVLITDESSYVAQTKYHMSVAVI